MIEIDGAHLTIQEVARVARFGEPVGLSAQARQRMQLSRDWVVSFMQLHTVKSGPKWVFFPVLKLSWQPF